MRHLLAVALLTISITGSPEFEQRMNDAIGLLDQESAVIADRLVAVVESEHLFGVYQSGYFYVNGATWRQDPWWVASVLVHEGVHLGQTPFGISEANEFEALLEQREALYRMDAPRRRIDHATSLLVCVAAGGCRWWEPGGWSNGAPPTPQIIMPRM